MSKKKEVKLKKKVVEKKEEKAIVKDTSFPSEQAVKEYLAGTSNQLTDEHFKMFFYVTERSNLNPLLKEAYAIPYRNKRTGKLELSIITNYNVYIQRAEQLPLLDGWHVETVRKANPKTQQEDICSTITIYRKDWAHPFTHDAWFSEYNQGNAIWREKPITMNEKCATGPGFRLCFPTAFKNMPYIAEELPDYMTKRGYSEPVKQKPLVEIKGIPTKKSLTEAKAEEGIKQTTVQPPPTYLQDKIESLAKVINPKEIPYTQLPNMKDQYTFEQHQLLDKLYRSHCVEGKVKEKMKNVLKQGTLTVGEAAQVVSDLGDKILFLEGLEKEIVKQRLADKDGAKKVIYTFRTVGREILVKEKEEGKLLTQEVIDECIANYNKKIQERGNKSEN